MPNINVIHSQVGVADSTPSRGVTPQAMGSDVGGAVAQLGDVVTKVGMALDETRRSSMIASAVAQSTVLMQEEASRVHVGAMQPDGTIVPPPDPNLQDQMFQTRAKEIHASVKSQFKDDNMFAVYQNQINPIHLRQTIDVRKNALISQKQHINADLDTSLTTLASAAGEADEVSRPLLMAQGELVVQSAMSAGVYTPDEANKRREQFRKEIATAGIRKSIRSDPDEAAIQLLSDPLPGVPESERQKWIDVAIKASEQKRSKELAEGERSRRERDRVIKAAQEETAHEGWKLAGDGKLTPQWVDANFDDLTVEEHKQLMLEARGDHITTKDTVYAPLRLAASNGVDVRARAERAYYAREIKRDDFDRLISEVEQRVGKNGVESASWYKAGEAYLKRIVGADQLNPPVGATTRAALVLDWFRDWAIANPKATEKEAKAEYHTLGEQAALIDQREMLVNKPAPRYLVGGRQNPQILESYRITKEAWVNGVIDRGTFEREAKLLDEWDRAQKNLNAAQQKDKAVKPENK